MKNKFILWLGISLVCFAAFVLSVRAMEKETVSLTNVDGQIEAVLELPVEENQDGTFTPPEDIVALQLSFQISGPGSIKKEDVSFAFGSGIPEGATQEYRYQEDTGVLNIYISGRENIYNSKNISLGKVIVNSDEKTTVKVVKNSFKTINRAHDMYEGEVNTGDGGQIVNNGNSGGNNKGDDDVGEIMKPPEEAEKPDEGSSDGNSGGGISSDGKQDEEQIGKTDKNKPSAGTTGSAKKILNASLNAAAGNGSLMSNPEDGSLEGEGAKGDMEEDTPLIPENSLWEDGAKLWREKTGAVGMDVWTKIFFGLFACSAVVAGGIGVSMAVRTSGNRKRRRRRRVHGRRNVYASAKQKPQTKRREEPIRVRSGQPAKRTKPARRPAQSRRVQEGRPTGRVQGMHARREQPAWKDGKKTYVRKRRKIS